MKKNLQTAFLSRQYMLSRDFELYYYEDKSLSKVDLHSHDYYEFYFFLEGDIEMQIGKSLSSVVTGDIILIPPGVPHKTIIKNKTVPYRRFVFWISKEYCEHLLTVSPVYGYVMQHVQKHSSYIFHTDRVAFNGVQYKLLCILEEMRSDRFGREVKIALDVEDLILHINRMVHAQHVPKKNATEHSLYQMLVEYIEEHITEDLSLESLSEKFYVSKYHISHLFTDNTGIPIHQYITKKRLGLCREAILGQMSISDAYQLFGFGDYSSFYRAFKKEYGISPKDYRDMQLAPTPR